MESPLYDQIGRFLISQKLKGSLKSGESPQEYIVKGYSLFGDAEDIILEVETPDKRPHRISLNQHLSDLVISQPLAQSSPKLTPFDDFLEGARDLAKRGPEPGSIFGSNPVY